MKTSYAVTALLSNNMLATGWPVSQGSFSNKQQSFCIDGSETEFRSLRHGDIWTGWPSDCDQKHRPNCSTSSKRPGEPPVRFAPFDRFDYRYIFPVKTGNSSLELQWMAIHILLPGSTRSNRVVLVTRRLLEACPISLFENWTIASILNLPALACISNFVWETSIVNFLIDLWCALLVQGIRVTKIV